MFEPITPVFPPDLPQARLGFVEPLLTAEAFTAVIARLTGTLCTAMEQAGQGARRLDLLFERVDGSIQCLRIGTARPSRDARHLARLLGEKLERVDPGLGVEAMRLVVPLAEQLAYAQASASLSEAEPADQDVSRRWWTGWKTGWAPRGCGAPRRWKATCRNARCAGCRPWDRRAAALGRPTCHGRCGCSTRRSRWTRWHCCRTSRRWRSPGAACATVCGGRTGRSASPANGGSGPGRCVRVRDYFQVEDEEGRRFWLFRRGDGEDAATGDLRWFLHGFF